MQRIILPVDFSEESINGAQFGLDLFGQNQGADMELILFHAHASQMPVSSFGSTVMWIEDEEDRKAEEEKFTALFNKLQLQYPDILLGKYYAGKDFFTALVNYHEKYPIDLVVLGTHQRDQLGNLIWGSSALDLARKAPCPILIVPPKLKADKMGRILLATDYDDMEDVDMAIIKDFSRLFNAEIMLLHVYKEKLPDADDIAEDNTALQRYFGSEKVKVQFLKHDDVVAGIESYNDEYEPDLLVLISHRRNFFERLLHKSVSKQIIMHADRPILVVHEDEDED